MKDNHKYLKRFLAFALSVAMVITYMPVNLIAYAENEAPQQPVAEEVVDNAANTEAPAPQDEVTTEEPAPVQEEVAEPAPAPVEEEPAVEEEQAPAEEEQQVEEPAEETPAEETTEPEKEVSFPAQTFNADKGGVKVLVKAPEGALPEGTEMVVTPANTKAVEQAVKDAVDGEVTGFKAVDITFVKDGEDVEPKVPVHVYLNASGLDNANAVVHIPDNGPAEVVDDATVNKAGIAKVVTDQFSVYAVVEEGDTSGNARAEVIFKSGDTERATVYVKNADTLDELEEIIYDPGVGELAAGKIFKGWIVSKDATASYDTKTKTMNIEEVRKYFEGLSITEGDKYYVHAVILDAYTVTYKSETGTIIDSVTVLGVNGSTEDFEINMTYEPENPDIQQFQGWFVSGAATDVDGKPIPSNEAQQVGTKLKVNGNVTLTAKAPKGNYLIFKENGKGATYTVAQFIETGKVTEEPADPSRLGYEFDGWYTGEPSEVGGDPTGSKFTFGSGIDTKTYLYAKWKEVETANYTVIIWKQSVKDAKDAADSAKTYDFGESVTLSGNVGSTINTVTATGSGDGRYASVNGVAKSYPGFHLNKYDTNVTIDATGSSVVNVYYDRNLVTLTFQYRNGNSWATQTTMTGLYGQTLASQGYTWPTNRWWYESYRQTWSGYEGSGTRTTFLDAFKLSDDSSSQTFYGFGGNGNNHVYFYKQNADGTYPTTATNTVDISNGGTFYISDKYNGYKAVQYSKNGTNWTNLGEKDSSGYYATVTDYTNLYIRYAPLTYNILFMDGVYVDGDGNVLTDMDDRGQLHVAEKINFESSVASYNKGGANYYEPKFNAFAFEGWYADDACTQPYTFTNMPEGITVYAKWRQVEYRVFLHPNVPTSDTSYQMGDQATSFRVSYGEEVQLTPATRDDYELMGWYYDEGCTKIFSSEAYPLTDSTPGVTAYDKSRSTETDKYGNVTENVNKDTDRFWITKSLDLYAKWRSTIPGAKGINVVYDANGGSGAPKDDLLYKDKTNAIAQGASTPASEDEQFVYWVVQKWNGTKFEDTDQFVYPGDTFEVLRANAKVEDITPTEDEPEVTKKYTVQLRAEYTPKDTPTPTHIYWYKNDGTEAFHKDDNLAINKAVNIEPAQTREGYVFKGWARIPAGNDPESSKAWEANQSNWTQDNADQNMYLYYDGSQFHLGSADGDVVTEVAADEKTPYHAMFAVWAAEVRVEITGSEDTQKYNGKQQSNDEYTVKYFVGDQEVEKLPDGVTFTPSVDSAKGTDVGTYNGSVTGTITIASSAADKYVLPEDGGVTDGTLKLTITKRSVTLTSATDSKVYDGTALTNDEVTVGGDGFVSGEGATYDVTGSQTEVGSSANKFTYTLNNGTKADNYTITKTEGTLTVTELTDKVTVTITENSGSEKYDGTEKTATGYTVSIDNELYTEDDFTFSGNDTVKGTDAGSYPMELKPEDFTNTNKNFKNVEFVIVDGTLEISKRTVTLTSADDEKVYDGTALTNDEVTVGGDGFATGEGATYDVTGTQTNVGSSANKFDYTLNEGTKAANYTITKTEGTLEVTPVTDKVTVTITENSGTAKYDGTEKTVEGYTVEISNPLYTENDFTFDGDATVKGTDAGSYDMELTPEDFTNISKNFSNVEFVIVDGTLEISKRTVTMTSATDSKTYDGKALTNDKVTETGDGFVEGEGATYDVTGTQTDAGSSKNTFTYTLNKGTKADNYEITQVEGTLTVTADEKEVVVVITENSGSEKYDGTEKTVTGYKVTSISSDLYKESDFTFSGDATVKGTDAGSYDMELKPTDFTNNNKNFTKVTFQIVDGTLEISKRTVTLTSATDEKVYDGKALTNDEVTVGGDGFADGEGAKYDVTGTQTDVGSSQNSFSYTLNEGTKADNYDITQSVGTLTVTPVTDKVTVTITGHKDDVDYNGAEQKVEGYDVSIDNELYTEEDFTFSGDATAKGTDVKKSGDDVDSYPMGLKAGDFENISKNFTNVEFVVNDGSLKIEPIDVTIESASAKKVYDGTPLTKHDEMTIDGFVDGEGLASIDVTGSQTYVGTSDNTFTYKLFTPTRKLFAKLTGVDADDETTYKATKATNADNYNITVKYGTLEVTDEDVPVDKVATKKHEDKEYKLGEKVVFTIEVTNIYAEKKDITVTEQPGVTITSESEFKDVEPGAKVTVTAEYVVTEADILAGEFNNKATVEFSGVDKPYEPEDKVDVEDPKSHLTIDKKTTSTPANGKTYALGETITYEVKATNDGNMTLKNIEVTDELTGDAWSVEELAPGESKTFTTEHTVTEKDIIAGVVKNEATATAEPKDPEAPKPEIVPGTTEDPTDESNPHLTVVKETTSTPANGKSYEVGETVTYEITVTNDGNLTVKDIEVKDDLTGDAWNIESLAPDKSQTFNCEYTVTEEDAKNGSVTNIATATGTTDDPNHPYPTVVPGEKTVPVAEPEAEPTTGVKTGDDTNIPGMVGGFFASVVALFGALFIRRRRSDEE